MAKTLLTIWQVEVIDQKEFVEVLLDEEVKVFIVHITSLSLDSKIIIQLA